MPILLACTTLSFLYCILLYMFKKLNIKILLDYHVYIWASIVLLVALFYPHSYIRNWQFDFLYYGFLKDFALICICAVILSRFSGYASASKRYNFNFIFIFPLFEEILFRGTILPMLIHTDIISVNIAVAICALLFGVMHVQYFGLHQRVIAKVIIAMIGGYFFSKITYGTGSIIPSFIIHMIFNYSAILFSESKDRKHMPT